MKRDSFFFNGEVFKAKTPSHGNTSRKFGEVPAARFSSNTIGQTDRRTEEQRTHHSTWHPSRGGEVIKQYAYRVTRTLAYVLLHCITEETQFSGFMFLQVVQRH